MKIPNRLICLVASLWGLPLLVFGGDADTALMKRVQNRVQVSWQDVPKKVLAFYYGWYGNPETSGRWVHWSRVDEAERRIGGSTHFPKLGPYDSHGRDVVAQHCQWAKQAGLDGFIATWWHPRDFHDQGMPLLLEECARAGLEVSAYFETAPNQDRARGLEYVLYLLEHYGRHQAWLKLDGKPVLFVYGRAVGEIGLDGWLWIIHEANQRYPGGAVFIGDQISKNAARIFDGIHTYNITGATQGKSAKAIQQWAQGAFPDAVATAGPSRIACLTLIPGYDDTTLGRPEPRPTTARHGGETYEVLWEEAIKANPDWILITSWNEWHEGSEIEPSVENGDRELKNTPSFAARFKKLPARPPADRSAASVRIDLRERESLVSELQNTRIAVLPQAESEAYWSLILQGGSPTPLSWDAVVDPKRFSPDLFSVVLYACGESYRTTVHSQNDVLQALQRYVRDGGTLLVLSSEPLPFHYDAQRRSVSHWRKLGLPMNIGWEKPPTDHSLKFKKELGGVLPHVPAQFAFPETGDLRWRPVWPDRAGDGVRVRSLLGLYDGAGSFQGSAVAEVRVGKGRLIHAWFRLLDMPQGEALLHDLWQLALRPAGIEDPAQDARLNWWRQAHFDRGDKWRSVRMGPRFAWFCP